MADENRLEIELVLDDGSIKKAFVNLERQSEKTGKQVGENFGGGRGGIFGGITKSLKSFNVALAGAAAGATALFAGVRAIRAAAEQEKAVNQLNTSLRLAGEFSEDASKQFQDLAKSIQATSTFGDETILQFAALARNFTTTNEEAERLTKAAVDLSAATGLSLESSIKNLGKTFAGLTGELGESVPILRTLTAEQLKAGAAIDLILDRFGGAAAAQLNTFSGSIENAGNVFGDLFEDLGNFIVKSPAVIGAINGISKGLASISKNLFQNADFNTFNNNLRNTILLFASLGKGIFDNVVPPLELIFNILKLGLTVVKNIADIVVNTLGQGFIGIAQALQGNFKQARQSFNNLKTGIQSDLKDITDAASVDNTFDFKVSLTGAEFFNEVLNGVSAGVQRLDQNLDTLRNNQTQANEVVAETFGQFASSIDITVNKVAEAGEKIQGIIKNGIVRTVSTGIQNITQSLIKGTFSFTDFAKNILAIVGDLAIQLGQTLILTGIGVESLKALGGAAAIAAGAGLIALGTILKSLGGSSEISAATGGVGGDPFGPQQGGDTESSIPVAEPQPSNQINVNIAGDVLDSDDTGLRIATLLQNEIDRSGQSILQVT